MRSRILMPLFYMLMPLLARSQNPYYPVNYGSAPVSTTFLPPAVDLNQHGAWHLVWSDEFSGTEIDQSKWKTYYPCHDGGGDQCPNSRAHTGDHSVNLDANVVVTGGKCILKLIDAAGTVMQEDAMGVLYPVTRPHTSGVICTYGLDDVLPSMPYNSMTFPSHGKYKFEASIRLCGTHNSHNTMWLWSDNGGSEIDIMEYMGNNANTQTYTFHNYYNPGDPWNGSTLSQPSSWADGSWHTYGCEWDMNVAKILIDGFNVYTLNRFVNDPSTHLAFPHPAFLNPNSTDAQLRFTLAIDGERMYTDLCQMEIDWVRVYQRDECTDDLAVPVYNLFPFDNLSAKTITMGTNDPARSWNYMPHTYEGKLYTGRSVTFLPNYEYTPQLVTTIPMSWGLYYDYSSLLAIPKQCEPFSAETDYDYPHWGGKSGMSDDATIEIAKQELYETTLTVPQIPELRLYPNPVSDEVTVSLPCKEDGTLRISVADVDGRVIYTGSELCAKGTDFRQTVDMREFAKGVYIVTVTFGNQHIIRKVTKV